MATERDFGNMLNERPATKGKSPWTKLSTPEKPKPRKKGLKDYSNC